MLGDIINVQIVSSAAVRTALASSYWVRSGQLDQLRSAQIESGQLV